MYSPVSNASNSRGRKLCRYRSKEVICFLVTDNARLLHILSSSLFIQVSWACLIQVHPSVAAQRKLKLLASSILQMQFQRIQKPTFNSKMHKKWKKYSMASLSCMVVNLVFQVAIGSRPDCISYHIWCLLWMRLARLSFQLQLQCPFNDSMFWQTRLGIGKLNTL